MKDDLFFEDSFSADVLDLLATATSADSDNFNELTVLCGIDPTRDFRHADLTDVDFSNSDLTHHDFTGADLRGAYGCNVKLDQTTILRDANTKGSLFAYSAREANFFRQNPEAEKRAALLSNEYWGNALEWVIKSTGERKAKNDGLLFIAGRIVYGHKDGVVRTNTLLFMRKLFGGSELHKDYLIGLLVSSGTQRNILLPSLRVLARLYSSDPTAYRVLKSYVGNSDIEIRRTAIEGVTRSAFFHSDRGYFLELIRSEQESFIRRLLVRKMASLRGLAHIEALEEAEGRFIDFVEPLTHEKLKKMASFQIAKRKFHELEFSRGSVKLGGKDLDRREGEIAMCILDLIDDGVRFTFTETVESVRVKTGLRK